MDKNVLISILSVIVMQQSGFIETSNMAARVLAPMVWYLVIMFTLIWMDEIRRQRKEDLRKNGKLRDAALNSIYHSYIVNKKGE